MPMALGSAYITIRTALEPLKSGLGVAYKLTKGAISGMMKVMSSFANFTYKWAKRFTLAIIGAITTAIWQFAKFEAEILYVSTMLDTKGMQSLSRFAGGILDLSVKTGQATKALSLALYKILSASFAPTKAMKMLNVATRMAVAGGTDAATATEALVRVLNSYGLAAERAEEIADKLFMTTKRGQFEFAEIASTIGNVAALAKVGGLRLNELLAAIAAITKAGVPIHRTITGLASVMNTFIAPTNDAKKAAKGIGLELSSATLKGVGLIGAIQKLSKVQPELLAKIITNRRALLAMAAATGSLADYTKFLGEISVGSAGAMTEAYDKMASGLAFQFGRIKKAVGAFLKIFGEPLGGAAKRLVGHLIERIKDLAFYIQDNRAVIKKWADMFVDKLLKMEDKIKGFAKYWYWAFTTIPKEATEYIIKYMKWRFEHFGKWFKDKYWSKLRDDILPIAEEIGKAIGGELVKGIKMGLGTAKSLISEWYGGTKFGRTTGAIGTGLANIGMAPLMTAGAISGRMPTKVPGGGVLGNYVGFSAEKILSVLEKIEGNTEKSGPGDMTR